MPFPASHAVAMLSLTCALLVATAWAQPSCTVPDLTTPATCGSQGGWVAGPISLPAPHDDAVYAVSRGYDYAGGCERGVVWAFFATPHCRGGERNGKACDPLCAQGIRGGVRTPAYCSGGCDGAAGTCNPDDDLRCDTSGGHGGECTPVHWVYRLPDACAGQPRCDDPVTGIDVGLDDWVPVVYVYTKQGNVYALRDLEACAEAKYEPGGREDGIIAFKDSVPGCVLRLTSGSAPPRDTPGVDASNASTAYVPDKQATMWALDAASTAPNDFDRIRWCFRTGDLAPASREFCGCPSP